MPSTISAGTTAGTAIAVAGDTTGNLAFQTNGTTTAMTIDTSQRVGIGTTSPANILELKSATPIQIFNQTTGNSNQGIQFQANGTTYGRMFFNAVTGQCDTRAGLNNGDGYYLTYSTDGSERMRVTSDGYLLVGCTSVPSSSVAGVALSPSVVSVAPHRFSTGSGTGVVTVMTFANGNGVIGAINTSGSNTVYATSSDYRLKENVAPMTGALAKVAQLKPCTYTWKSDGSNGEGFIAHELAEVFPDAVVGEKDAVDADGEIKAQSIDTSFLVATLTAAIQELKAELDATKAEVAALKQGA